MSEWVNLTQMTTISTTVGKNPLEEMEEPSVSSVQFGRSVDHSDMT